jgi:transcriptional regulator with XRE-family HTH domain
MHRMDVIMSFYGKSDLEILRDIAGRLKRRRLNINISQQELADRTGISRNTVSYIEQGKPFGVLTLIQILRGLDALDELDSFLPDPGISPLQLARMKGRERLRAYRKGGPDGTGAGGDDAGRGGIEKDGEPEW